MFVREHKCSRVVFRIAGVADSLYFQKKNLRIDLNN